MPSPPKRVEDMTESERLQSLKEWAEEQKYVRPGEGGTLPHSGRGMQAMVFGGPMNYGPEPQYSAPIGPPTYENTIKPEPEKKRGPVGRWLQRRREKRDAKVLSNAGGSGGTGVGERPPEYS